MPHRSLRVLLPRYAVVGAFSVVIDVGSLTTLHTLLSVPLLPATIVAFVVALVVNYSLNHVWAFDADGMVRARVTRYAVLVGINFALTLGIVTGLTAVGVFYLLAKAVSIAVASVINFVGYRRWVFR